MEPIKPAEDLKGRRIGVGFFTAAVVAGLLCVTNLPRAFAAPSDTPDRESVSAEGKSSSLYVVDCLLPGQLRKLGNRTYMTPRRPVRTTVSDCAIRGGEYTAWDRANYETALRIWLPAAEAGDPEAMNYVGEIFERGLGTTPNFEIAALWYERGAQAGYQPAQVNLAMMYDTGKGVEKDPVAAINWYRKAWGVPENQQLLVADEVAGELEASAARLAAVEAENATLAMMAESQQTAVVALQDERDQLLASNERLKDSQDSLLALLDDLPAPAANSVSTGIVTEGKAQRVKSGGRDFGRYYALVIGNGSHRFLADLITPPSDARRIADVLTRQYGFEVTRIENGDDVAILQALNSLYDRLEPEDNLLIYYAGYGNARTDGALEVGYWLPVNAERPPIDTYWLPVAQIGAHLARLPARRILVIADSSFAGLVAETPAFFFAMKPELLVSDAYINLRFGNRSRLLISSNRDFPRDATVDGLSEFATGLAHVLESANQILSAPALFLRLREQLGGAATAIQPTFKSVKGAGDAVGDFYFVPQA